MTNEQMYVFAQKRIDALKLVLRWIDSSEIQIEDKESIKKDYKESLSRWEDFLKTGEITHEV